MTAKEIRIKDLLSRANTQFIIPLYQRNYDWEHKHCKKLFDDIITVGNSNKNEDTHFIGSVVYMKDNFYSPSSGIDEFVIIDGQQRITTITLLYLALSKFAKKNCNKIVSDMIYITYLTNQFATEEGKLKLRASENNDLALKILMESNELDLPDIQYSRVDDNLKYFMEKINNDNFETILRGINRLTFVEISLERGKDDPQKIFETMNSTGLELSQADLIRNFMLMGLEKNEQDRLYSKYWEPIEQYTNEIKENRMSDFIRDYLTLKTTNIPNIKEVYEKYKEKYDYRNDKKKQEEHLLELKEYSKYYSKLIKPENEEDTDIKRELKYIKQMQINVSYPFFMQIYKDYKNNIIDKITFIEILKLIQSYIIRRLICNYTTNYLNKMFATLYNKINKDDYLHSLQKHLCSLSDRGTFPNDNEIKNKLSTANVYILKPHNKKYIFELLENYNNKEQPIDLMKYDNKLTIEHIFPQKPSKDWENYIESEEINEILEKYLNTIGNLTLTAYNSKYNNKYFLEKKYMENGFKESGLKLNRPLVELEKWDLSEIKKRTEWMIDRFCSVWKHPNIINSNFIKKESLNLEDLEDYDFSFTKIIEMDFLDEHFDSWNQYDYIPWLGFIVIIVKKLYSTYKKEFIEQEIINFLNRNFGVNTNLNDNDLSDNKTIRTTINLDTVNIPITQHFGANYCRDKIIQLCYLFNLDNNDLQITIKNSNYNI